MFITFIFFCVTLTFWWRDVFAESALEGEHTNEVKFGLRTGMKLFIASEVLFFLGFFWGYFHSLLNPSIFIGAIWPPKGIFPLDPASVPLASTILLITSSLTITYSHKGLLANSVFDAVLGLLMTLSLGITFTFVQCYEYLNAPFAMCDSIFGSTFYMITGLHGLHVVIGTIFLLVNLKRIIKGEVTRNHHIGYVCAIWYWHFVDAVWVFVYLTIYIYGK